MRYNIENIDYVITGKQQKMVNLVISGLNGIHRKTFVTDEGQDKLNGFSQEYNTHRLKILSSDLEGTFTNTNDANTIFSLFDMRDIVLKYSEIKGRSDGNCNILYSKDLFDKFNSYISSDPIEFCQLNSSDDGGSYAMGIAMESEMSPALKKTNLLDTRFDRLVNGQSSLEWHYKIMSDKNGTFTYIPLSDYVLNHRNDDPLSSYDNPIGYYFVAKSLKALSNDAYDFFFGGNPDSMMLSITLNGLSDSILYDHRTIEANQIFNIITDGGKNGFYNDFNNGIIRGTTSLGKNDFNAEFSMDMDSIENIKHARNYIGLGTVGNKLFLKYYDELEYDGTLSGMESENGILPMESEKKIPQKNSYQNVETYDSTMSFMGNYARHKSNLYAITVRNSGLSPEASPSLAENMNKIREQVANSIRTIAEKLAPAHTQLLQVNFEDEDI